MNLHSSLIDFSEKRPLKFEIIVLEFNELFLKKGPLIVGLTLEFDELLQKETYKIWTYARVK